MAYFEMTAPELDLDDPVLVEGLPGMGLIGKLVTDHLLDEFGMTYYAGIYCEGVPSVAAYRMDDSTVRPPIQVYADADRDLLILVSDIPVSPSGGKELADCVTDFLVEHDVTAIYTSGFDEGIEDAEDDESRDLYGIATGDGDELLERADIGPPHHAGIVTGATGSLLNRSGEVGLDSVGLLIKSSNDLPDIRAARTVIEQGIEPITGVDVDTGPFADGSIEMSAIAESVLETMQASSRVEPTPTFQ